LSLTRFDFSKLFDLNVLVIESDPSSGHQLKQILTGLGIKKLELSRSAQPLLSHEGTAPYDVIFLDYDAEPSLAGADLIELLLHKHIVSPLCRLVVLSAASERQKYAVDYPFHQVDFLDRPCNKFHIDEQLKLHVRLKAFMDSLLPLIHKRRYVDAFKLLSELQQKAGVDTPLAVMQLKAELLLELGVCDAASTLIKSACTKQQGWALWLQFLLDYEQGDLDSCQNFLATSPEELAGYQERKEVWQIYLALELEDYANAFTVASKIPAAGMSTQIAQLVQLVMMMADKAEQAIELIERKRRLAGSGYQFCVLTISLCKLLLHLMTQSSAEPRVAQYQTALQQSFKQLITDKEASQFAADIIWLQGNLVALVEGQDAAIAFLDKQKQHLAAMQMSVASLCQGAGLMASLGKMNAAFDLMYLSHKALNILPHSMHRVYASCVHQQAFHLMYAQEQRGQVYALMGLRHEKEGELRPAAKMYYKAYLAEPGHLKHQEQLANLLSQLKLSKFKTFVLDEFNRR
jgi:DNA-binding response OmpR family regulator